MNNDQGVVERKKKISKKQLYQMFFRNFSIQGSWNYERQMNMGCMYSMAPILDKLYDDDPEEKKKAYKRHMVFFNNNMYVNTFVMGILGSVKKFV